jgi:pimeloyl-ACP methyl ester carboxylesterase
MHRLDVNRSRRWRTSVAAAVAAVLALLGASVAAWAPDELASRAIGDVAVSRWISERDGDRVGINHYAATSNPVAAVLYLPGTHMNGQLALADERDNLWLFLANRGITVYAIDYRSHFIPAEIPPDAPVLERMADWTAETYVGDALHGLAHIREQYPDLPVFVMGFSRGAALAYGVACLAPSEVTGLVALDGGPKRDGDDATGVDLQAELERLRVEGRWADDVAGRRGWDARQEMMQRAIDDQPDGRATLARVLHGAWGPGRLANPDTISETAALARLMIGYDRYYPAVQNVEGRAIAAVRDAPHTPVDDCWGMMTHPILAIEAERFAGVGASTRFSAERSGSDDVEVRTLSGFGHLDVLVARDAQQQTFEPVYRWMMARLP